MSEFPRITIAPDQMGGVPCIRGLRIPVAVVVDMVAEGMSTAEIVRDMPDLEADDVTEALKYAARLAMRPAVISVEQAYGLMDRARSNANLDGDDAMNLAVREVQAYRAERHKTRRS